MTTEASVRFLPVDHDVGNKPALCIRGRKHATCVVRDDSGIRLRQLDLPTFDRLCRPVLFHGHPYPIDRAAKMMLSFTKRSVARCEITQGAKVFLDRILNGSIVEEEIEVHEPTAQTPRKANSTPRSSLLKDLCDELKLDPRVARRVLRAAGLHAPYEDEKAIRKALKAGA